MATSAGVRLTSDVIDQHLRVIDVQRYTSSDVWSKPAGAQYVRWQVQGGGGGGGGAPATAGGEGSCGSGGEGGAYVEGWDAAADIDDAVTVTVGGGGAGNSGAAGDAGGDSSFGAYGVAPGGTFGNILTNSATILGQNGGSSTQTMTGDLQIGGQHGGQSLRNVESSFGGKGGDSMLGHGGSGVAAPTAGRDARGFGGGGGGAANGASDGVKTGGSGTGGIVIVTTYA